MQASPYFNLMGATMSEPNVQISDSRVQEAIDREHLKLLSVGYWISGAMTAFFSLMGLMYMFMGVVMHGAFSAMAASAKNADQVPPPELAWIFGFIGFAMFAFLITLASFKFRAAWCLKRRRSRTFCMVVAGITCIGIPYGTLLGVYSFIVLGRPSVQKLFDAELVA
jgi:hypothetical protein